MSDLHETLEKQGYKPRAGGAHGIIVYTCEFKGKHVLVTVDDKNDKIHIYLPNKDRRLDLSKSNTSLSPLEA